MAYLKEFMGLFGVIIGSLLTFWVKTFSDNKVDKRKLNGLLYFLLQLRYFLSLQQKAWEDAITKKVDEIKTKIPQVRTPETDNKIMDILKHASSVANVHSKDSVSIEYFENNIEAKLLELAEIDPILAYEISENHKIKDKLRFFENYSNGIIAMEPESENFMNEYLKPKIINAILEDIDESISTVAKRISRKTLKESIEKIALLKDTYKPKDFKEIDDIFRNFGFEM